MMKKITCLLFSVLVFLPTFGLAADAPKSAPASAVDELKVLAATPQGELNALDDGKALTITFDRPVVALAGVAKDVKDGPLTLTPKVSGVYRWTGTATLTFIPDKLFYATSYAVQLKAPLKAVDGSELANDYNFSFVTPRPQVESVFPYQEQTQVTLEQPLFIQFNQPVDAKKAVKFIALVNDAGKETPIMVAVPDEEDIKANQPGWLNENSGETVLKIVPQAKFALETAYTLKIKAGMPGKTGNLGMKKIYELKFQTYNHFRVDGAEPGNGVCADQYYPEYGVLLRFSNSVKWDDVRQHVHFSPELKADAANTEEESYDSADMRFETGLQPNTAYTVTVDADLQDIYGNRLGKPATFEFQTKDYGPYLVMPTGRMISEAYLGARFPIKMMNVENAPFKLKAYRTPEDMLKAAKLMANYEFAIAEPDVDREYQPDLLKNKLAVMPFDLGEALQEDEQTGVLGLTMQYTTCRGEPENNNALIFLTNLSATAKFSADNSLFWVTQLKDSSAVAGAEIELYDENQKFLWKGATDQDGFLSGPGWKGLGLKATSTWEQPWVFAIVRAGKDQVVIHSRDGAGVEPYRFDIDYQPSSEILTNDGYLFTERGIYRPGEEVKIVGIIRDKKAGEFVIPKALEMEVIIADPAGKEVYKNKHKLSEYGSFHLPLKLAENAKIGTYAITCKFPVPAHLKLSKEDLESFYHEITGDFKVEMYRPVEFEVKVKLGQEEYVKGDQLTGDVQAAYLFGGAVRKVPLEWNLNRSTYYFYPQAEQFNGYAFNASDREELTQAQVAQKNGELDENGEYKLDYALTDAVPGSFSYSLDATVTDVNQRMVSSRKSVVVHGGEYYIGLKTKSFFANTGEPFAISTIALSPQEQLLAGQQYQVTLKRIWWESVRRAGNGGRLAWESEKKEEVVQELPVQSANKPVELAVKIEKVGYYKIEAQGTDRRGNVIQAADYFYAIGKGYAAWMRADDDYVELVREKEQYQPGDTAKILVKSPYEKVKALVTVEREGVMDRWVETIEGSAATIQIPIKPQYIPNVYIGVILIQGRLADQKIEGDLDLGKPGFKMGYTGVKVNPAERRVKVNLTTAQEEYRPGTEVEVQLQVVDQKGQGQEAEVIVSVVDVGVLNLIGYQTPDPFDYFYRTRPLAVLTAELRNSIVGQRNYSEKGERRGGGGVDMAAMMKLIQLREKFEATPYHNPEVHTDAQGRATVKFKLPDNLTAFRIMATAHTKKALFGAGEKRITVNKPLMLTSALPTFLRLGDTIKAGILAHNRTAAASEVTIQAETEGVTLASDNQQQIKLPKDDKKEVLFSYNVPGTSESAGHVPPEATLIFRGQMGAETDGLKVKIPILLHRLPLTTALFGSTTENSHQEAVAVPEDATPGWGEVKLSMAATLFTDLKGGVDFLFDYPYGCLEQKISRILPIILAEDLIKAFNLDVFKQADYKKVVQRTLDEFAAYQADNGGFDYWQPPTWTSPFVSAYAVFTMAMAKQKGYVVDEDVEQKAVTYLENVLKGQPERATLYRYNNLAWNATDAFILYALTLHNKYQPAYATRLFQAKDQLPVFGKALLLKAVQLGKGDATIKNTLKDALMSAARIEARTAYFAEKDPATSSGQADGLAWIHSSNVRTTAAVAEALLEVYGASKENEAFVSKAIQWLLTQRKQKLSWRTTQENLFVFWALATYSKTFEAAAPDFTGKILVNGQEILTELFQGRTTKLAEKTVPLEQLTKNQNNAVDFTKDGKGRLYYTAALTYLPAGTPEPIDYGIAIQKKITVIKGVKGQEPGVFRRGDLARVDLTVTTPADRLFVFLDDPLPAGFKALNLDLKTSDQSLRQFLKAESPFEHSEFKDDRVVFYANYVGQGVYTVSYLVSAEHSGRFNLPPTFAAEMYTPEVFGQTGVNVIEIQ